MVLYDNFNSFRNGICCNMRTYAVYTVEDLYYYVLIIYSTPNGVVISNCNNNLKYTLKMQLKVPQSLFFVQI